MTATTPTAAAQPVKSVSAFGLAMRRLRRHKAAMVSIAFIIFITLVAIFAPLGDLVESQLKRNFGVKDSGNIIPGHGGILDRLDSFIICAPVVYFYFVLEKMI